jgi:hypothetical protein
MKTIGINIDGIIRDSFNKFDSQYRKVFIHNPSLVAMNEEDMTIREYTEEELDEIDRKIEEMEKDMITLPMDSAGFLNHYKFEQIEIKMTAENILVHNGEVYEEAPQDKIIISPEEALNNFMYEDYALQIFGQTEEIGNAMEIVNKIQAMGFETGKFEVVLLSTCKRKAVPATYSFLALKNCRVKKLVFVNEDYQKWDYCDILVDVMPESIQSKPSNKVIVKINQDFNKWDEADYSYDTIRDFYRDDIIQTLV